MTTNKVDIEAENTNIIKIEDPPIQIKQNYIYLS